MTKWMLVFAGLFSGFACGGPQEVGQATGQATGDEGPVASTEQAVTDGWIGPVSDEAFKQSATCGSPGVGATAAFCAGRYCDDMYLFCGTLPAGFSTNGVDRGWTPYVSEENNSPAASCPSGSVIDGIRATGSFSDNVSVHCTGANFPSQGWVCWWQSWFSEEQGQQNFSGVPNQPNQTPSVAVAVRCSGSFCDNLSFLACAPPPCSSNADCASTGRICDGGLCKFQV